MAKHHSASRRSAPDDLSFMQTSDNWPRYPILPIKRKNNDIGFWDCAILFADGRPIVYHCNMFQLADKTLTLESCKKNTYDSFEALVADGWIVD